jgi:hypothetical protein
MQGHPYNPHGVELHVFKRAQEASDALGVKAIGDLPQAARNAVARIASLEQALGEAAPVVEAAFALASNEFLGAGGVVDPKAQLLSACHRAPDLRARMAELVGP